MLPIEHELSPARGGEDGRRDRREGAEHVGHVARIEHRLAHDELEELGTAREEIAGAAAVDLLEAVLEIDHVAGLELGEIDHDLNAQARGEAEALEGADRRRQQASFGGYLVEAERLAVGGREEDLVEAGFAPYLLALKTRA